MGKQHDAAFPLLMCAITVIGLCSALIDSTIGWDVLAHTETLRAIQ